MGIEDNGPESAYPGPAEPGTEEEVYPDAEGQEQAQGEGSPEDEWPENPPVDEAEEPSPGSSA